MKFQGDIVYLAYVLNLIVQDILKTLIKDAYIELDNNAVYNIENEEDEDPLNNLIEDLKGIYFILYLNYINIYKYLLIIIRCAFMETT
jgi:hypothetical protein